MEILNNNSGMYRNQVEEKDPVFPPEETPEVKEESPAWNIIDNVLGVVDKFVGIWKKATTDTTQTIQYGVTPQQQPQQQDKFLGMPKPVGISVLVITIVIAGVVIYKKFR